MIDDEIAETDNESQAPPDHPASTVNCDHPECQEESPDGRLCDECTPIMRASYPNTCTECGATLQ